jgi:hypothetical protein
LVFFILSWYVGTFLGSIYLAMHVKAPPLFTKMPRYFTKTYCMHTCT